MVSIEVDAGTSEATLAVMDRGYGIEPEELSRIFDPFYRAEYARRLGKPGIGLGLAVVRRLVMLLGGRMDVESKPGNGSRFRLSLPLATEETQPAVSRTTVQLAATG